MTRKRSVEALTPHMTGRWLVRTRHTTHLFDLDTHTYKRTPGPNGQAFDHDGELLHLNRVDRWPQVGDRFLIWCDDPELPEWLEHWRVSSPVREIVSAETARERTTAEVSQDHPSDPPARPRREHRMEGDRE